MQVKVAVFLILRCVQWTLPIIIVALTELDAWLIRRRVMVNSALVGPSVLTARVESRSFRGIN